MSGAHPHDAEGVGCIPYGPLVAWAWCENLDFTSERGFLEPNFHMPEAEKVWLKVVDDALAYAVSLARALALHGITLPSDLKPSHG